MLDILRSKKRVDTRLSIATEVTSKEAGLKLAERAEGLVLNAVAVADGLEGTQVYRSPSGPWYFEAYADTPERLVQITQRMYFEGLLN